jgi:transposase
MVREAVATALQRDAQVSELAAENDTLRALIQRMLRHRFGRRSEQLSPDQLQLAIEHLEQDAAYREAAEGAAKESEEQRCRRRAARPRRNLGVLPEHLPRDEVVIDMASRSCPCCGGALHLIDETRAEMLDIVPAQLRVKVIRRPRYGCRSCAQAVMQAAAVARPIDGGMATEALLAHVLISKFADFLPLYRQSEMLKRQGIVIDRSTLGAWVGRACRWLRPLYDLVVSTVLCSPRCSPTTPRCRCSTPAAARPKRVGSGAMPSMIGLGGGRRFRRRPISTAGIARPSIPLRSWRTSAACCRSMATAGSPACSCRGCPAARHWRRRCATRCATGPG